MSESLKTLLQQALDMLEEQALHIEAPMLPAGEELLNRIRAAISQQVEPAPAQDEREAVERFSPTTSVPHCGRASEVEAYMTDDDDGEYMTVAQHERIVAALTRPAQTEQQPFAYADPSDLNRMEKYGQTCMTVWRDKKDCVSEPLFLRTAPIAQPAPRPTGLSKGWNLVRQCDGFVIGHSSEEPSQRHKEQALADGRIYVPFLVAQTAPHDTPVEGWPAYHKRKMTTMLDLMRGLRDRYKARVCEFAPQPEQSGLVEALEWYADCGKAGVKARVALAAYRAALPAQGAGK